MSHRKNGLSAGKIAHALAETIVEWKAEDVRILDLRGLTDIADFFVIASAQNRRHLRTLGEELLEQIKAADIGPFRSEGLRSDSWIILDLFDVVVHLFLPERREYYSLDGYWADAPVETFESDEEDRNAHDKTPA